MNKNLRLNFCGDITLLRTVNSYEVAMLADRTVLYCDGSSQRSLTNDFLFPAWLVRVVPAEDATMQIMSEEFNVDIDNKTKVVCNIKVLVPKDSYTGAKDVELTRSLGKEIQWGSTAHGFPTC